MINFIRNFIKNFGKNEIYLGRWNNKNTKKYMDWANYDNCYQSLKNEPIKSQYLKNKK